MTNPLLPLLQIIPTVPDQVRFRDGTIHSVSPLSVLLEGDTDPTPPTKAPLVGALLVNQRVLCLLAERQLIILGRYGG